MNEGKKERILTIVFDAEIAHHEVPLFRGAIIQMLKNRGEPVNILFHNHNGTQYRFSYPLIQYKRIHKKAAIVCIGDGADAIGELLSSMEETAQLGYRSIRMKVSQLIPNQALIHRTEKTLTYSINRWIPLNSNNYVHYSSLVGLAEKTMFLEKTLIGNILSFGKGVGVFFDGPVEASILEISNPYLVENKGVKMMAFDAVFNANVALPNYIGIGKHVSTGSGIVTLI